MVMAKQSNAPILTIEDKKLNMQINFYIMRKLWAVHHGKKRDGNSGNFYHEVFESSRARITRVIDGYNSRFSQEECANTENRTGVPREYISGHKRFSLMGVSEDDWKEYCNLRREKSADPQSFIKNAKHNKLFSDLKNKINNKIETYYNNKQPTIGSNVKTSNGADLFIYFLDRKSPVDKNAQAFAVNAARYIKHNNINTLNSLNTNSLEKYVEILRKHFEEAQALLTVRKAEEEMKKASKAE